jgi:hypothetical protein
LVSQFVLGWTKLSEKCNQKVIATNEKESSH